MDGVILNENEKAVLLACTTDAAEFDGHNFQSELIAVPGLTKRQVIGYLGVLATKELITMQEDCYFSAFITDLGREQLLKNAK